MDSNQINDLDNSNVDKVYYRSQKFNFLVQTNSELVYKELYNNLKNLDDLDIFLVVKEIAP